VVSDVIQIFAGGRDYIVTCNAEADRELEMAAGCQQIVDTIAFGAPERAVREARQSGP
jgi:hypothetical protein